MSNATVAEHWKTSKQDVRGEDLLPKVKELVHQGNVRRIVVANEDGATVLEIPLTAGVVGALVAPARRDRSRRFAGHRSGVLNGRIASTGMPPGAPPVSGVLAAMAPIV